MGLSASGCEKLKIWRAIWAPWAFVAARKGCVSDKTSKIGTGYGCLYQNNFDKPLAASADLYRLDCGTGNLSIRPIFLRNSLYGSVWFMLVF